MQCLIRPLIRINWEQYAEENELEDEEQIDYLKGNIRKINREGNNVFELNEDELIPKASWSLIYPKDMVNNLTKIVGFLEDNDIPWEGMTVPFMRGETPGFFIVTDEEIIIAYLNSKFSLDKEIFNLPIKRKLI